MKEQHGARLTCEDRIGRARGACPAPGAAVRKVSLRGLLLGPVSLLALATASCPTHLKRGFDSPDMFLDNPFIEDAVDDSAIPIYEGTNPPSLQGTYAASGEIARAGAADPELDRAAASLVGAEVDTTIRLFNQTQNGRIDLRETLAGGSISVDARGGYITGSGGRFTIWQESDQRGATAGLPAGVSIHVAVLFSGTRRSNGDLDATGLSVVTESDGLRDASGRNIDRKVEGLWWSWRVALSLGASADVAAARGARVEITSASVLRQVLALVGRGQQVPEDPARGSDGT